MNSILIVEDDELIAQQLVKFFKKNGFTCEVLITGKQVVSTVKTSLPDLVILDIMLPVKDGISCCKEIREFSDVPVIILTAKVEEMDRIIGLNAGADDYVCKPFSAQELVLRVKAILKRSGLHLDEATLKLNSDTYEVAYNKQICELSHLEFSLFNLLYQKPGRIYSRAQIIELAYPDMRDIFDRTIDCHIKNIRKKLKKLPLNGEVIGSVYGAGYRYLQPAE